MGESRTKILIVTRGAWRDDNNSGNTFTNLFAGWPRENVSNIYISPELPQNNVCENYFQINDKMLLSNIFKRQKVGKEFSYSALAKKDIIASYAKESDKKIYDFVRIHRFEILFVIREILWKAGKWKNNELKSFLKRNSPDIIFAPLYDTHYTHALTRYISKLTGKKIVTLISDDVYTYKQFNLSLVYWVNRYFLRKNIRKTIKMCDLIYIMAPKQKEEYDKLLNIKSRILYKGGNFKAEPKIKVKCNNPIKIVYTGNVFAGRWKTLSKLALALKNINKDGIKAQLFIYTQNPLSRKMKESLKIADSSFLMGSIPYSEVKNVLSEADIVVHAESMEIKNRLLTRLSFSTKIVDYFESGRCILAVGSKEAASIDYLIRNNAAVVLGADDDIEAGLKRLIDNPELIIGYGTRAWECGKKNHELEDIRNNLKNDLALLVHEC